MSILIYLFILFFVLALIGSIAEEIRKFLYGVFVLGIAFIIFTLPGFLTVGFVVDLNGMDNAKLIVWSILASTGYYIVGLVGSFKFFPDMEDEERYYSPLVIHSIVFIILLVFLLFDWLLG